MPICSNQAGNKMACKHKQGLLFAMYFKRGTKVAVAVTNLKPQQMSINEAHQKL
jgi:hypothetical protein